MKNSADIWKDERIVEQDSTAVKVGKKYIVIKEPRYEVRNVFGSKLFF